MSAKAVNTGTEESTCLYENLVVQMLIETH